MAAITSDFDHVLISGIFTVVAAVFSVRGRGATAHIVCTFIFVGHNNHSLACSYFVLRDENRAAVYGFGSVVKQQEVNYISAVVGRQ